VALSANEYEQCFFKPTATTSLYRSTHSTLNALRRSLKSQHVLFKAGPANSDPIESQFSNLRTAKPHAFRARFEADQADRHFHSLFLAPPRSDSRFVWLPQYNSGGLTSPIYIATQFLHDMLPESSSSQGCYAMAMPHCLFSVVGALLE
jgi:hypothetical protein